MSQTKAQLLEGTTAQNVTVDNINTTSINTGQVSGSKNLVQNGAFQIAQRASSSTTSGYGSVDRWQGQHGSTGVTVTHSQQSTSSSDEPYQNGFQNFFRLALSGAGTANAGAFLEMQHRIEAQNMANSGWNFKSSSSNITLSFWVRPSTNQTFYCYLRSYDGTGQHYAFSFTADGNNTWTKITKTIPGNTNLQFDNNNGQGLQLVITPFYGTTYTNNLTLNQWAAQDNANYLPDMASTWLTAGASTFDVTGVQLETGSTATDFEHRSFGEELSLCQRYYERIVERDEGSNARENNLGMFWCDGSNFFTQIPFKIQKRAQPTLEISNFTNAFRAYGVGGGVNANTLGLNTIHRDGMLTEQSGNPGSVGFTRVFTDDSDGNKALVAALAEL